MPPSSDEDEQGWRGTVTTDRWLAVAGGLLGGAIALLGWGISTAVHLNRKSKEHRP